jgi:hypothetical protein
MEGALKQALNRPSLDEPNREDEARQLATELVGVVWSAYGIEDTIGAAEQMGAAQIRALATLAGNTAQLWELISKSSRGFFGSKRQTGATEQGLEAIDVPFVLAGAVVETVLGKIGVDASAIFGVAGKLEDGGTMQTERTNTDLVVLEQEVASAEPASEADRQRNRSPEKNERHDDGSSATILSLVVGRLKDHVEDALQMAAALLDDKVSAAVRILVRNLQSGESSVEVGTVISNLCVGAMKLTMQSALETQCGVDPNSADGTALVELLFGPIEKSGKDPKALAAMQRDPRLMWADIARIASTLSDNSERDKIGLQIGALLTSGMERTLLGRRLAEVANSSWTRSIRSK